jgi:uncharacterized membrane protein
MTSLDEALKDIEARVPGGILLFSDGIFMDRFSSRQALGLPLFEKGEDYRKTRFYPVLLSSGTGAADIGIAGVEADDFAYVKNLFNVNIKIHARGHRNMTVPVRIMRGREVAATADLKLKKGKEFHEIKMSFIPEKVGYFIYSVSIPAYSFENTLQNNRKDFSLKVIRDRIRVLHVCGRPSWDVRFLRRTLKKDPAVDLIAFYILRTISDFVNVSTDELSLIEFPYRQLFQKDLYSFDLVIFQNFSYRTFFSSKVMENISRFVERGGAFMMAGGDISFSEGGYRNTAVEKILPYRLVRHRKKSLSEEYTVNLTQTGRHHPILSGIQGIHNFRFEGINVLGEPNENGKTLIKTSTGRPFFGIREVKKGRVAALAGDCLWFFNFVNVGRGEGNRAYQELIKRTVRWLIKDPAAGVVSVSGVRAEYARGSSITFSAKLSERKPGGSLVVKLVNARGKTVDRKVFPAKRAGNFPVDFKNPGDGIFIVKAEIVKNKHVLDYATESFGVSSQAEYGDGKVNVPLLTGLAKESSGRIIDYDDPDFIDKIDVSVQEVKNIIGKKTHSLWNALTAVIIIVLFFAVEWFIRKRNGLL